MYYKQEDVPPRFTYKEIDDLAIGLRNSKISKQDLVDEIQKQKTKSHVNTNNVVKPELAKILRDIYQYKGYV